MQTKGHRTWDLCYGEQLLNWLRWEGVRNIIMWNPTLVFGTYFNSSGDLQLTASNTKQLSIYSMWVDKESLLSLNKCKWHHRIYICIYLYLKHWGLWFQCCLTALHNNRNARLLILSFGVFLSVSDTRGRCLHRSKLWETNREDEPLL